MNHKNHSSDYFTIKAGQYTYPLFDTFWENETLRGSLWPLLPSEPSFENKNESFSDFQTWVLNFEDKLFKFIEVK